MQLLAKFSGRIRDLKSECVALYFAARHPQTPWYAKVLVAAVVAYAMSPIDLIPDFVPVLGYLDDLILVPLGVWLVVRLTPPDVLAELRTEAARLSERPVSRTAAAVIVLIWVGAAVLLGYVFVERAV
jgi:uncharacterized membrane protein YkvA (DUF1232 family)